MNLFLTNPQKNFEKFGDGLISIIEVLDPVLTIPKSQMELMGEEFKEILNSQGIEGKLEQSIYLDEENNNNINSQNRQKESDFVEDMEFLQEMESPEL